MSGGHKLSAMVGIGNSGQWSFFVRPALDDCLPLPP
jgi:hypothetical protein